MEEEPLTLSMLRRSHQTFTKKVTRSPQVDGAGVLVDKHLNGQENTPPKGLDEQYFKGRPTESPKPSTKDQSQASPLYSHKLFGLASELSYKPEESTYTMEDQYKRKLTDLERRIVSLDQSINEAESL